MSAAVMNERPSAKAQVRYLRMSASKVRVVLDLIRGEHVADAEQILLFSERLAASEILKVMRSAIANAGHNEDIPAEELIVSACFADEGPTLKRFRPRARGRAGRINKRTCHVTVIVSRMTDDELDALRERAAAKASGTPKASRSAADDRARRVAKSRGDEVAEDEVTEAVDAEAVEADVVEAVEVADDATTTEVESDTVDSDDDGVVNAEDVHPYGDGSHALIDGDPDQMPEGFPVKGNDDSKLYHNENSPFYGRTKAEVWFANDEAAEAAGFSKPESQQKKEAAAAAEAEADGEDA